MVDIWHVFIVCNGIYVSTLMVATVFKQFLVFIAPKIFTSLNLSIECSSVLRIKFPYEKREWKIKPLVSTIYTIGIIRMIDTNRGIKTQYVMESFDAFQYLVPSVRAVVVSASYIVQPYFITST